MTRSQLKQADAAIEDVAPPKEDAAKKEPAWTDPAIDFLADTDDDDNEETPSFWMPAPKAKKGGRKPAQKETATGKGGVKGPKKDGESRQATDKKQATTATKAAKKAGTEGVVAPAQKSTEHPSVPAAPSKRKRGEEVEEPATKRARLSPEGDDGIVVREASVSPRAALPAPFERDAEELGPLDAPPTPCTTWNDRVGSSPEPSSPKCARDAEDDNREDYPQPAKRARMESPEEGEIIE